MVEIGYRITGINGQQPRLFETLSQFRKGYSNDLQQQEARGHQRYREMCQYFIPAVDRQASSCCKIGTQWWKLVIGLQKLMSTNLDFLKRSLSSGRASRTISCIRRQIISGKICLQKLMDQLPHFETQQCSNLQQTPLEAKHHHQCCDMLCQCLILAVAR